jgi:hypothetical protein
VSLARHIELGFDGLVEGGDGEFCLGCMERERSRMQPISINCGFIFAAIIS